MKGYGSYERRKIDTVVVMATIIAFALATFIVTAEQSYSATKYSYTGKRTNASSGGTTTVFKVPALGIRGLCCQHDVSMNTSGKVTLTKLSNKSDYAKVAYYWGIVRGYDKKAQSSNEVKRLERMLQHLNDPKGTKGLYYVSSGGAKRDITKAKSVEVPETFVIYRANPTDKAQDFIAWKNSKPASLTLVKTSTDPAFSTSGGYSFAGIKYQVYRSDKKTKVGVLTCKAGGTTNTITGLAKGTYYAKEKSTNSQYALSSAWLSVTVGEGKKGTFKAKDAPLKGKVKLTKGSTDPKAVTGGYDFKGIVYGVYATKSTSGRLLAKLTLNAAGVSNVSGNIPVGKRYIREISTNSHYKLSNTWYTVTISSGKTAQLTASQVKDEPVTGRLTILKKIDGGESTDEVFRFDLISRENSSVAYRNIEVKGNGQPVSLNVLAGEYILRETDCGEYTDETGDQDITIIERQSVEVERVNRKSRTGSLQVRKTTDDSGSKAGFRFKVTGVLHNEGELTPEKFLEAAAPQIIPPEDGAEIELGPWTVDEEDLKALNEAAGERRTGDFIISMTNTVMKADEQADLKVDVIVHLAPVILDDEVVDYMAKATEQTETTITESSCTIRFNDFKWNGSATEYRDIFTGEDHTILVTDNRGSGIREGGDEDGIYPVFPGEYTVSELMTEDQLKRYKEAPSQTAIWDGKNGGVFRFDFENKARTTGVGLKKTSTDGKVSGIEFRLSGRTAFGENIRKSYSTDDEGRIDFGKLPKGDYVVEEIDWDEDRYANSHKLEGYDRPAVEFSVSGDESEDIVIGFENVPLAQMKLTKQDKGTGRFLPGATFSVMNKTKNTPEATFRLVEDGGFPQVEMLSSATGIKVSTGSGEETAAEEEENDEAGDEEGDTAGDGEEPVDEDSDTDSDGDGDEPEEGVGTLDDADDEADDEEGVVSGDRNWISLTGLTSGDRYEVREIDSPLGYGVVEEPMEFSADHEEAIEVLFEDERSRIGTSAADTRTGEHVALASEKMSITDTVSYENLVPGKEYRLEGTLMDKSKYLITDEVEDVSEAKDSSGNSIKSSMKFTPSTSSGSVKVVFSFNGIDLQGSTLVVYEKLFTDGGLVTSHEDPSDEAQTIVVPDIKTTALSKDTRMHIGDASSKCEITDAVAYTNLEPGLEYHLTGTLMDRESGEPLVIDGEAVRAEADFIPEASSGTETLTFRFDASGLAGSYLVAFEDLKFKGKTIAEHKDPNDPAQTVRIPEIGTIAERTGKNRIEDTVSYKGLIPEKEYVMTGVLVDKKSGKPIDGTETEKKFTPEKSSGKVIISFGISADSLLKSGIKEVVAFERCDVLVDLNDDGKLTPVQIASHRDLDDVDQTVDLTEPIKKTRTGDDTRLWLLICMIMFAAAAIAMVLVARKRSL